MLDDESPGRLLDKLRRSHDGDSRAAIDVVADSFVASNNALFQLAANLNTRLVAIRGVAGVGKTHLAADLAKPTEDRPSGVLVLARQFGARFSQQQLAAELLRGQTDLDLALNGLQDAAARAGCRLPIVIDGLSESDRPADWRDLLTRLRQKLAQRPMLALIATVRPDYVRHCLPDHTADRTLFPFTRAEARIAVRRYFEFFKIDAGVAALPWRELSNPLFLRIFCRAINPERQKLVAVSQIPTGLANIFELFLVNSIRRAADARGFHPTAARDGVRRLAEAMWQQNARALPQPVVKQLLGDDPMAWADALTNELLSEGVLRRDPPRPHEPAEMIGFVFDALAGHTIADALITRGALDFDAPELVARLAVAQADAHPFAEDVVAGLDSLYASRRQDLVWARTSSPELRSMSLVAAAVLPAVQIRPETVEQAVAMVGAQPATLSRLLPRIIDLHGSPGEPFNADLLDRVLLPMGVWQRDLIWSEWMRANDDLLTAIVADWTEVFRDRIDGEPEVARLGIVFLSWCLTTTDRAQRDRATEALWWIGRKFPEALFAATIARLSINDPYVSERLLAASYGVAMANARPCEAYAAAAPALLSALVDQVVRAGSAIPVSHWLMREHSRGMLDLAMQHQPSLAPAGLTQDELHTMPIGSAPSPLDVG